MSILGYIILDPSLEKRLSVDSAFCEWFGRSLGLHAVMCARRPYPDVSYTSKYKTELLGPEGLDYMEIWITTELDRNKMPRTAICPPGNGSI